MKPSLVDTDTLSFFFKGDASVIAHVEAYCRQYGTLNFSIITYYEIISGLKRKGASKKLDMFLDFAKQNSVLPLTETAASFAAEEYARLCRLGTPIDDIDLLIAGTALANDLMLVTHNTRHFERISNLELADWMELS